MANPRFTQKHAADLSKLHAIIQAQPDGPEKEADKADFLDLMRTMDPPLESSGPLDWMAQKGLEAADYGSGLVRSAIPLAVEATRGALKGDFKQFNQDAKDAIVPLEGRIAPGGAEYFKRWGFPAGPSTEIGRFKPDVRDAAGAVYDTMFSTGGLGAFSRGLPGLAKSVGLHSTGVSLAKSVEGMTARELQEALSTAESARKAMTQAQRAKQLLLPQVDADGFHPGLLADPVATVADKGGEALYRSPFKEADRASMEAGQGRVSSGFLRRGIVGTAASNERRMQGLQEALGTSTAERATGGPMASPIFGESRAGIRGPVHDFIKDQGGKLGLTEAADQANDLLRSHFKTTYGPKWDKPWFNMQELQDIKQQAQTRARDAGEYNTGTIAKGGPTKTGERLVDGRLIGSAWRKQAQVARQAIEDNLDNFKTGMGGQQFLENRELGAMNAAEKPMAKAATAPLSLRSGLPGVVAGTMMAAPAWAYGSPGLAAALMAAGLTANSTIGRTALGLAMHEAGPMASTAARAAAIPVSRKLSTWEQLQADLEAEKK